ncbi:ABC transporter substrate-binding protein [Thermostichus lividus]|jgi:multiple sugar transport system substrate-binding protein|uniref:ABC transporter substrate-binding protein n=1 Tax=Parathermosynechococcus lividus PCC 6715 TaxID=1917166 RepID=A0A2D2PZL1_PARLV|nr:ABC transporter substrate-binding protein [Thermostichus lividus PCC 6715]
MWPKPSSTARLIDSNRRWLLLGLLALLSILLVGCSAPRASDRLEITFWHGVNPPANRVVLQRLVDRFNAQHPQIHVQALYVGQPDQQLPKILAAVVGDAAPDLLWYNPTITGQFVDLGALRPLDDWWATTPYRKHISPALLPTMRYGDHYWSIPFATNNVGIFYRPSLFAAAGITTLPTTWQELEAVAQTLKTTGTMPLLLALGQGEFTVFTWLPFFWSAGGHLGDTAATAHIDTPAAITALEFWQRLRQKGLATLSAPERGYELDQFIRGEVAMQISGPWTLGQLQQSGVDFDVLAIPALTTTATALGGENLFVFRSSPEREQAALEFLSYVLSEEFQTEWAVGTGYLPVNEAVLTSDRYQAFLATQPTLKVFLEQLPTAQARPNFRGYARFSQNVGRAIESVLLQKATPTAAVKTAESRWQLMRPR